MINKSVDINRWKCEECFSAPSRYEKTLDGYSDDLFTYDVIPSYAKPSIYCDVFVYCKNEHKTFIGNTRDTHVTFIQ